MDALASRAESAGVVRSITESRRAFPLRHFRWAVERLRPALSMFTASQRISELAIIGPNKGGKTTGKAAYMLGCVMKLPELDGVRLPQWDGAVEGIQLCRDYPQQLDSVRPAYKRLLGDWPHHASPSFASNQPLSSLRVMPLGGNPQDDSGWSSIHFMSQKNLESGVGARADVIDFDEPAVMPILRELRKAGHAGRRSIILHGFTPTKRIQWAPVREDYGDTPRKSLVRVRSDVAVVRWSLDEVANWCLSDAEKSELRARYLKDPLFGEDGGARWHGDYMDTDASSPWGTIGTNGLLKLFERCEVPAILEVPIVREAANGQPAAIRRVKVEIWGPPPRDGERFYLCVDPASGVDDGQHNPAGLHVHAQGSCDLRVRWNGYLAPYSLGVLAATIGRLYNLADVDVEMKDHWGVNVVRGLHAQDYPNLCHEVRELRPGEWSKEIGFDNNDEVRSTIIGCIQEWLEAAATGIDYAACPSRAVLDCLAEMRLDDRGKIVAGDGIAHAEDAVLLGQSLRRAWHRQDMDISEYGDTFPSEEQENWRRITEEDEDDSPGMGLRPRFARPRL